MATELTIESARKPEGYNNSYLTFTASLSAPAPSSGASFSFRTRSGTALEGSDYERTSGTVTFRPGDTSATFSIYLYGDTVDEVDESFAVEIYNPVGVVLSGGVPMLSATGTILDDDGIGSNVAMSVSNPVLYEGASGVTTAHVVATLSQALGSTISVPWQTANGTALAGSDYTAASGTLTFLAGQTTAAVDVAILGDTVSEPTENFSVVFAPPAQVAGGAVGAAGIVTIVDDDATAAGALPTISIANATYGEGYNNGYMYFTVTLSTPAPSSGVKVSYRTRSGTATERDDFERSSGTLTFQPGQVSGDISIYVYGETVDEVDESFVLELYNPTAAVLAGGAPVLAATGIILDDDGIGANLALAVSSPVMREGNANLALAHVEATLSRPSSSTITVGYQTVNGTASAGEDYIATNGTLTFLPGQTTAAVDVAIIGDTTPETTEAFSVVFTPGFGVASPPTAATVTILADDDASGTLPVITLRNASYSEGYNNGYMYFDVLLSSPAGSGGVTVSYNTVGGSAFEGTDFERAQGTLTIRPGESSGVISVYMYGDTIDELDEGMTLGIYNAVGAVLAGNATILRANGEILDDDGVGTNLSLAAISPAILEGDAGTKAMHFEALLSRPSSTTVVVPYQTFDATAVAGLDYTPVSGTLTFLPGQTLASVDVPILSDLFGEPAETFSILFSGSTSGATTPAASATGLIVNDDSSGPVLGVINSTRNSSSVFSMEAASAGGPGYLKWQYIYAGADAVTMSTQGEDVFLHSGSGTDALQVASGHNVLDGGTGSNFLTGGTGIDTFFTDARGTAVVWNTIRNYGAGDAATLWGFVNGVSSYRWEPAVAGASGFEGATLRANIVGGAGRSGDGIDASITFTGMSVAQAKGLQLVTGTQPAGSYLYIYNPGV